MGRYIDTKQGKVDVETMRIFFGSHINALCNINRHEEAEEYFAIRDRLIDALCSDVTPVTHAHWVDRREGFVDGLDWGICSHCKNLLPTLPYCGFCGAKMDEEVE